MENVQRLIPKRGESWDSAAMKSALKAVTRGKLSQREASVRYKIPRRTLRDHLKSESTVKGFGRKSTLLLDQEKDLVCRIIRLADVGLPLTMKILRYNVFKFCSVNNIQNNFNQHKQMAGKDWMRAFLKRNPEVSRRKAQFMNQARAQKLNKFIVDDHFKKLGEILDHLDIKYKPEKNFNMDEKGCRLTMHHQPTVLAKKGTKRVHFISNEHAENVTIVGCVSAIGSPIPPMVIFKGKRLKPEFTDNLPPGSIVRMTPKGYMTTELFIDFINHLAHFKPPGKILLIFDGAACHLDLRILNAADQNEITLFCLPSNTTHELQPLDKSVYRSFEHHWDIELVKYQAEHPDRKINKTSFNKIFSVVWSKCMTHSNIINGFRVVGIYPYNPDAIPETAFAPSVVTAFRSNQTPDMNQTNTQDVEPGPSSPCLLTVPPNRAPNSTPQKLIAEEWESEDELPLTQLVSRQPTKTPFKKLLPTPDMKTNVSKKQERKKSLNYKAQTVTKDLFQKDTDISVTTSSASRSENKDSTSSWYCPACNEDQMIDMRQCQKCEVWFHEECLGISGDDIDVECPSCDN